MAKTTFAFAHVCNIVAAAPAKGHVSSPQLFRFAVVVAGALYDQKNSPAPRRRDTCYHRLMPPLLLFLPHSKCV